MIAHFGRFNPESFNKDFVASLTAKKTAPAGIFDTRGAVIPSKLPENSFCKFWIVYCVLGICSRTVAVSRGYFTRVLVVDTKDPETKPDMLSWNAVGSC